MPEFTFKRIESIERSYQHGVTVSRFENGAEQRRLTSPRKLIGFSFRSSALTKSQADALDQFYGEQLGELIGFNYEDPFTGESLTVRFEGEVKTDFRSGHFRATWKFQVIQPGEA